MKGQHQKTIRTLLSSVREYKKASLWCPVFVVLEVLMEVLVPGVMALIIDKGINGGSINYILKVGAVLILMSMLALFFGIMAGTNAAKASAGMAGNLRMDMFHHIQDFSFANIDRFSSSSLETRLTTDDQCTERISDGHPDCNPWTYHAGIRSGHGAGNQQGSVHDFFYHTSHPRVRAFFHCD